MKTTRSMAIVVFIFLLLSVPAIAQDAGTRDTLRFEPTAPTWTIDTEADTLFDLSVWAWSDAVLGANHLSGMSTGFRLYASTTNFPTDSVGSDDSLFIVNGFTWDPTDLAPGAAKLYTASYADSSLATDPTVQAWGYNGFSIGLITIFPADEIFTPNTSVHLGDVQLRAIDPANWPCEFDIVIDSTWFPPAGAFKFSPSGANGFPPEYSGSVIHVVNNLCTGTECPVPVFTATPPGDAISSSHCETASFQFTANAGDGETIVGWAVTSGGGTIDGTGLYQMGAIPTGSYPVTVEVENSCGETASYSFTVNKTNANPVWQNTGSEPGSVNAGSTYSYDFDATDTDACDVLHYTVNSYSGSPTNVPTIDELTGAFEFVTTYLEGGTTFDIEIGVFDDQPDKDAITYQFSIVVICDTPVFTSTPGGDEVSANHCDGASFQFAANGNDGQGIQTWSVTSGPGSIDGTGLYTYDPGTAGDWSVTVEATNFCGESASYSFMVVLTTANPEFTSGTPPGQVTGGEQYYFDFDAIDTDPCDVVSFTFGGISPAPVNGVALSGNTGEITWNSDASEVGTTFDLEIIAVDAGAGAKANTSYFWSITVVAAPEPEIAVTPDSLHFTALEGGANPGSQALNITNVGAGDLFWCAYVKNGSAWLSLDDDCDIAPSTLNASVNIMGMTAGDYIDTVVVEQDKAVAPVYIPVTLEIGAEPLLAVTPIELNFSAMIGDPNPADQEVEILSTASPTVELGWSVISGAPEAWLSFTPSTGLTPDTMDVSATIAGLPAGVYNDTITVAIATPGKATGIGDTVHVVVNLEVTSGDPEIDLSDSYFFFSMTEGDPDPAGQDLTITNIGSGVLNWTASNTDAWLTLTDYSGTAPSTITLNVSGAGIAAPDTVRDTVFVEGNAFNSPQFAIVDFAVLPAPIDDEDTVWVGAASGAPGDQVVVPVMFKNIVDIGGIDLPLRFDGISKPIWNGITCDSVSFVGTRVADVASKPVTIDNGAQTIIAGVIVMSSDPLIPAGYGLMANLYFSIDTSAAPGIVPIDTLSFFGPDHELMYADGDGLPIYPKFVAGEIEILESAEPCLDVSDYLLTFEGYECGPDPHPQSFDIVDCGGVDFDWIVLIKGMLPPGTITVDPATGSNEATVGVTVDIDCMPPGTYYDSLCVAFVTGEKTPCVCEAYVAVEIIISESPSNNIAGVVYDEGMSPIAGATVELYDIFPSSLLDVQTAGGDGSFDFGPYTGMYVVRAYADGYYQNFVDVMAPDENVEIVLTATDDPPISDQWVRLHCEDATFEDYPLLPGDVVEAYDIEGTLCGQFFVHTMGQYGFMHVYADDPTSTGVDEGCNPGEDIILKLNGFDVTPYLESPLTWTFNLDMIEACFDGYIEDEVCIHFNEGLNLVSWNVDTPDDDIEVVLSELSHLLVFAAGFEHGALTYDPSLLAFSTLWEVDHLSGYWIRLTDSITVCFRGAYVNPATPIQLYDNWNLVSYLPDDPDSTMDALASIYDYLIWAKGFYGGGVDWDPDNTGISTLRYLDEGYGYWLKVDGDRTLTYGGVPVAGSFSVDEPASKPRPLSSVIPTTRWVDVYGSGVTVDGTPIAEGSLVEAVTDDGEVCGAFLVKKSGMLGFMPVYSDDPSSAVVEGPIPSGSFSLVVNGEATKETFTWTSHTGRVEVATLNSLGGGNVTVPHSYELHQNYPNPFNPSTTLSYNVGSNAHVKLVVYNILGEAVKVLVDEYQQAGDGYKVVWDGTDHNGNVVSTGVYFYRITAGDYDQTKKMMLMK